MADPFIGEIHMFAGMWAPNGYAECLGQLLTIAQHDVLYSLIGTTYGGDGVSSFGIPDLRGRIPVHEGTGAGATISWQRGVKTGAETVTLTSDQLPAHTHTAIVSTDPGTLSSPQTTVFAAVDAAKETLYIPLSQSPSPPLISLQENTLSKEGESLPHTNMMPFLAIRFAIALTGNYPPRT